MKKVLEYVNVHHYLIRTSNFKLLEAIVLNMMWKRIDNINDPFPDSILSIEKTSGIHRPTIEKYIEKFKKVNIMHSINGKHIFNPEYEKYLEKLQYLDKENELKISPKKEYSSTYTCYHFDVAKRLNVNEMEYFFLDIHIGLFKKNGYGTSPKNYTMRVLGIGSRNYQKIKKKLFEKGYLERCYAPDLIKVSDQVVTIFGMSRKK